MRERAPRARRSRQEAFCRAFGRIDVAHRGRCAADGRTREASGGNRSAIRASARTSADGCARSSIELARIMLAVRTRAARSCEIVSSASDRSARACGENQDRGAGAKIADRRCGVSPRMASFTEEATMKAAYPTAFVLTQFQTQVGRRRGTSRLRTPTRARFRRAAPPLKHSSAEEENVVGGRRSPQDTRSAEDTPRQIGRFGVAAGEIEDWRCLNTGRLIRGKSLVHSQEISALKC